MTTTDDDGGWQPDPTGRHQYRYHDGAIWTERVRDDGGVGIDPINTLGSPLLAPSSEDSPTGAGLGEPDRVRQAQLAELAGADALLSMPAAPSQVPTSSRGRQGVEWPRARRRIAVRWFVFAIILVLAVTGILAYALKASSTHSTAARAYAGFSATFELAALAAAILALLLAAPSFLSWAKRQREEQKVKIWMEIAQELRTIPTEPIEGRCEVSWREFILRTVVQNVGTAELDARLNIFVPFSCEISVLDDANTDHHLGVLPVDSWYVGMTVPGDPQLWMYSISELKVPLRTVMFRHLSVKAPPGEGVYPIIARIRALNERARVDVHVK